PECQVLMPRLMSDLVPALVAARDGVLKNFDLRWYPEAALTVVMATKGYPGNYGRGSVIEGLDEAAKLDDVGIFPAGTRAEGARPGRQHPCERRASAQRLRAWCDREGRAGARLRGGRPHPLGGRLLPPRHRLARNRARDVGMKLALD